MRNSAALLTLACLLACALLTIWGLAHLQWPQALPWTGGGRVRYGLFLIASAMLVLAGSRWGRRNALHVGGAVAAVIAVVAGALWPLLVTLWFAFASMLLGRYVLSLLRSEIEMHDRRTSFLVGAGIYGTAVSLLAHIPVSYPGSYGFALALPLLVGWRMALAEVRGFLGRMREVHREKGGANALDVAIAVVALVYFVVALMPEVGYDALATHLFVPAHLALRHEWSFDVSTYVWAVMPMLGDWIFSIGYMLSGETAARFLNIGFIFVLGWLVRDMVLWAGGSSVGARWAVLLFLTMPLTFTEASSLFIESVWASFAVAGTLAVLRAVTDPGKSRFELPVAGLLLGFALAAKAVTFTILPALMLILVARYRSWMRVANIPSIVIGALLLLAAGLIPYLFAWWQTGNPVFPFFNHVFQSPYYSTTENFNNPRFNTGVTWDILYRITFDSQKYLEATAGASGFQWLLLFVPALSVLVMRKQDRGVTLLLVGVISIVLAFHSQSYLRYTFPAWVMMTAAIGVALSEVVSTKSFVGAWLAAGAVTVVVLNMAFLGAGSFYRNFPLALIFDLAGRDGYVGAQLPLRKTIRLVNDLNEARTPVAVFGEPTAAGLAADALYPNWYNRKFQGEIAAAHSEQELANVLLRRDVNFVILDSGWAGEGVVDGPATRAIVEKATESLASYGSFSVRKIKTEYRFKSELLDSPDFSSIGSWVLAANTKYDANAGTISASVTSPATQTVAVTPGHHYRNVVVARCTAGPTLGRVQVNWVVEEGRSASADVQAFECSPTWTEHAMEVTAPPHAVGAVVYTGGHTEVPVEFTSNSLLE